MSFRDDRDALASRVDALDRELGQARQALAEEEREHKASRTRERALAARVAELEAELLGLRPARPREPGEPDRSRLYVGLGIGLLILVVTIAMVSAQGDRPAPVVPDAPPVASIDAGVPLGQQHIATLYRYSSLLCVRLVYAESLRIYRTNRAAVVAGKKPPYGGGRGRWGTCVSEFVTQAKDPSTPPAFAELAGAIEALYPLLARAAQYHEAGEHRQNPALGDQLDAEIGPRAALEADAAERALAALRPAWLEAVAAVRDGQPDDREGRLIRLAVETMILGADLARDLAVPGVDTATAALLAPLLEHIVRLRRLADEELTRQPPHPAGRVLHLGAELRGALEPDGYFNESQVWELAYDLARHLGETYASHPPR